jgi:hypothetical protein
MIYLNVHHYTTTCIEVNSNRVRQRTGHDGPKRKQTYSSTLSLTSALDRSGWLTPRPGCFTPGKETRYPFYRRLGGPQGMSGRVRKISSPLPGYDSRTVLPIQSRYNDWAIATDIISNNIGLFLIIPKEVRITAVIEFTVMGFWPEGPPPPPQAKSEFETLPASWGSVLITSGSTLLTATVFLIKLSWHESDSSCW